MPVKCAMPVITQQLENALSRHLLVAGDLIPGDTIPNCRIRSRTCCTSVGRRPLKPNLRCLCPAANMPLK